MSEDDSLSDNSDSLPHRQSASPRCGRSAHSILIQKAT